MNNCQAHGKYLFALRRLDRFHRPSFRTLVSLLAATATAGICSGGSTRTRTLTRTEYRAHSGLERKHVLIVDAEIVAQRRGEVEQIVAVAAALAWARE